MRPRDMYKAASSVKKLFALGLDPGWRNSHKKKKKNHGARRKFWKKTLRDTKKLYCERGLNFFFLP